MAWSILPLILLCQPLLGQCYRLNGWHNYRNEKLLLQGEQGSSTTTSSSTVSSSGNWTTHPTGKSTTLFKTSTSKTSTVIPTENDESATPYLWWFWKDSNHSTTLSQWLGGLGQHVWWNWQTEEPRIPPVTEGETPTSPVLQLEHLDDLGQIADKHIHTDSWWNWGWQTMEPQVTELPHSPFPLLQPDEYDDWWWNWWHPWTSSISDPPITDPPHPPLPPLPQDDPNVAELVDLVCLFLSTFGDICNSTRTNAHPLPPAIVYDDVQETPEHEDESGEEGEEPLRRRKRFGANVPEKLQTLFEMRQKLAREKKIGEE